MSGRSAYVRKEKEKIKTTSLQTVLERTESSQAISINSNPQIPAATPRLLQNIVAISVKPGNSGGNSGNSSGGNSSGKPVVRVLDDLAYARVRQPILPVCDGSAIERSALREKMDRFSKNSRDWLSGKKVTKDNDNFCHRVSNSVRAINLQQKQFCPSLPANVLKFWSGGGNFPTQWSYVQRDPEMWDDAGDTLVFVGIESINGQRPPPLCRIHSHVLRATESDFFRLLLDSGDSRGGSIDNQDRRSNCSNSYAYSKIYWAGNSFRSSRATTSSSRSGDSYLKYEVYLPPKDEANDGTSHAEKLKHIAVSRNVLAKLHGKSLVGFSLKEALTDLRGYLDGCMPPGTDNTSEMIRYLTTIAIYNVSYDPGAACDILSWSEMPEVSWLAGWREAFVHSVGMFQRVKLSPQYKNVSHRTKTMLERAHFDVEKRMELAQEQLTSFRFENLWSDSDPSSILFSKGCFEKFRAFVVEYYEKACGQACWPPSVLDGNLYWLTRTLIERLQEDFGSLYQYLVNREIMWKCPEDGGKNWILENASSTDASSNASPVDALIIDALATLDSRTGWPRIPYPCPCLPPSYSGSTSSGKEKKKLFNSKSQKADKTASEASTKYAEQAATLSYKKSSNIMVLGPVTNNFLDEFIAYEESLSPREIDPALARRGHWFLIYAVMQTLATISVDTPRISFTEGVTYPLCCRMQEDDVIFEPFKDSWKDIKQTNLPHDSFCWVVPQEWNSRQETEGEGEEMPAPGRTYPASYQTGSSWPSVTDCETATGHSTVFSSSTHGNIRESGQTSWTGTTIESCQGDNQSTSLSRGSSVRNSAHNSRMSADSKSTSLPVAELGLSTSRLSDGNSQHSGGRGRRSANIVPAKNWPMREPGASIRVGNTGLGHMETHESLNKSYPISNSGYGTDSYGSSNMSFPASNNAYVEDETRFTNPQFPNAGNKATNLQSTCEEVDGDFDDETIISEAETHDEESRSTETQQRHSKDFDKD